MRKLLATTALGAVLLATPALAQQLSRSTAGDQSPSADDVPQIPAKASDAASANSSPGSQALNPAEQAFLRKVSSANAAEIELGTLAEQRANSDAVKQFGHRMVQDHSQANDQISTFARAHNVNIVKSGGTERQETQQRDLLRRLSGMEFDRSYIRDAVEEHQKDLKVFQDEANSGQNAELKSLAGDIQKVVADHLAMAKTIQNQLVTTSEAPNGSSAPGASSPNRTYDNWPPGKDGNE